MRIWEMSCALGILGTREFGRGCGAVERYASLWFAIFVLNAGIRRAGLKSSQVRYAQLLSISFSPCGVPPSRNPSPCPPEKPDLLFSTRRSTHRAIPPPRPLCPHIPPCPRIPPYPRNPHHSAHFVPHLQTHPNHPSHQEDLSQS